MVIFQTPGGSPGYNQFESLDDAVAFVEQLRNDRNVTNARIFALQEIKFELKPYFKVELQALNPGATAPESVQPPGQSTPAAPAAQTPPPPSAPAAPPPEQQAPAESAPPAPTSTFGAFSDQQAPAPAPGPAPAAEPPQEPGASKDQPTRRGLFGR